MKKIEHNGQRTVSYVDVFHTWEYISYFLKSYNTPDNVNEASRQRQLRVLNKTVFDIVESKRAYTLSPSSLNSSPATATFSRGFTDMFYFRLFLTAHDLEIKPLCNFLKWLLHSALRRFSTTLSTPDVISLSLSLSLYVYLVASYGYHLFMCLYIIIICMYLCMVCEQVQEEETRAGSVRYKHTHLVAYPTR